MAETQRLHVIGAGGFTLQMLDTLDRLAENGIEVVIADDKPLCSVAGYRVVPIKDIPARGEAVISISSPTVRRLLAERRPDLAWGMLAAETAIMSREAVIGPGAILGHGVIVEAECHIGRHFQANLYSYVAHECSIGDYVTFSPRVSCNGNVHIGNDVFVGTGAMIRQGRHDRPLTIGEGAFIGMGAIVTRDVPAGATVKASSSI